MVQFRVPTQPPSPRLGQAFCHCNDNRHGRHDVVVVGEERVFLDDTDSAELFPNSRGGVPEHLVTDELAGGSGGLAEDGADVVDEMEHHEPLELREGHNRERGLHAVRRPASIRPVGRRLLRRRFCVCPWESRLDLRAMCRSSARESAFLRVRRPDRGDFPAHRTQSCKRDAAARAGAVSSWLSVRCAGDPRGRARSGACDALS